MNAAKLQMDQQCVRQKGKVARGRNFPREFIKFKYQRHHVDGLLADEHLCLVDCTWLAGLVILINPSGPADEKKRSQEKFG